MPFIDDHSYWYEYLSYISNQEASISNVINYLSHHLNLLEKATLNLEKEFPIYDNSMVVHHDEFLPGQSSEEKIKFSQKIFEILFSYSKNLLVNFTIYQDRAIKEDTPQIRDYLSKFPSYSSYFFLMGYVFHDDTKEFRFPESTLTNEQQLVLLCMTICCCLSYDYWINSLKYLSLTIFSDQRCSVENLLKERKCEFCEYEIDPRLFQCTVCFSKVDKMPFYNKWQRHQSLHGRHKNLKNKLKFLSLNAPELEKETHLKSHNENYLNHPKSLPITPAKDSQSDTWQCACSYVNSSSQLNCVVCFNECTSKDASKIAEKRITETNPDMTEINVNNVEVIAYSQITEISKVNNELTENEWICSFCTTKNSMKTYNCTNCMQDGSWRDKPEHISATNRNDPDGDRSDRDTIPTISVAINELAADEWICSFCATRNSTKTYNCTNCMQKDPNFQIPSDGSWKDKPEYISIKNGDDRVSNHSDRDTIPEMPGVINELVRNEWICSFCTTKNSLNTYNCTNCMQKNPNFEVCINESWKDKPKHISAVNEDDGSGGHNARDYNNDITETSPLLNVIADYSLLNDHHLAPKDNIGYPNNPEIQNATVIPIGTEDKQHNVIVRFFNRCIRQFFAFFKF